MPGTDGRSTLVLPSLPLFVPGNRPQLFEKATASGADAIILDLEDAVAVTDKEIARNNVASHATSNIHVCVRVNAADTAWFEDDLRMVADANFSSILLPKCENAEQAAHVRARIGPNVAVVALIESALGATALAAILRDGSQIDQCAFGSIDFALDLGCEQEGEAVQFMRTQIVLHNRAAGKPAPLDGVTQSIVDQEIIRAEAQRARRSGFGGKLLIHPSQIGPAREGFRPDEKAIAWARMVLASSADGNAAQVGGIMIDQPVVRCARRILASSKTP